MANNREISQFASFLTVDESANNNVGIATTVRIAAGGLYVDGVEVIGPGGAWKGPNSGLVGAQGAQGADGAQGAQGAPGAQGAQGTVGAQGTQGAVGAQGTQGAPGAQGNQGRQGSPGAQGTPGSPGAQGAQGAQGVQGAGGPTTQLAKVWVNFNGQGTVSIRDDFNVNTISDRGSGEFTVNFSTAIGNNNYAIGGNCGGYSSEDGNRNMESRSYNSTDCEISTRRSSDGSGQDTQVVSFLLFSS